MACENCEDCNEEKNIEETVNDSSNSKEIKQEEVQKAEVQEQQEKNIRKYEDPVPEDYQTDKENKCGRKHIHKSTWDINYLDDTIM